MWAKTQLPRSTFPSCRQAEDKRQKNQSELEPQIKSTGGSSKARTSFWLARSRFGRPIRAKRALSKPTCVLCVNTCVPGPDSQWASHTIVFQRTCHHVGLPQSSDVSSRRRTVPAPRCALTGRRRLPSTATEEPWVSRRFKFTLIRAFFSQRGTVLYDEH